MEMKKLRARAVRAERQRDLTLKIWKGLYTDLIFAKSLFTDKQIDTYNAEMNRLKAMEGRK